MPGHFFISYSTVDGIDFALKLADELGAGPPPISAWVDKRELRIGDWDEQVVNAIRTCEGFLFIMSQDSVAATSICKNEWVRALRYKKPIIPLQLCEDAEPPFLLGSRQCINFCGSFESGFSTLRRYISWMESPEGQLQALHYRLADARRELPRAEPERKPRIEADIDELNEKIASQQAIVDSPRIAKERVQTTIQGTLEVERRPREPLDRVSRGKFVNPPPLIAPAWFRDRHVETRLIGEFLKDEALRLITIVGRGGVGKSAMVCRLLRALENGQLPDDGGPLPVDGIVYLSDARAIHRVNVPDIYAGLTKLLPEEAVKDLDRIYRNPQASIEKTFEALTESFRRGRTIILLDNFEDALAADTGEIGDTELRAALYSLLKLPPHGLKVIITTRLAHTGLALLEPALQKRLDLDQGLEKQDAMDMLRAMDADGKVGLKNADDALLEEAWTRTRGYPRALEHLFGILSADRNTSLLDILNDTKQFLPEKVLDVLVGEAFSRLDVMAQRVMQALAIYRYPVAPAAVDYLLQPYLPGLASGRVLARLVNMQFARRDAERYHLHQSDRDHALGQIPKGVAADRMTEPPLLTRFALRHRAAKWFTESRKPRNAWKSLEDITAQLSEFDLRCETQDYDAAAAVFLEIDFDCLFLWGHYGLMAAGHERLQGKITDRKLGASSVGNLGSAYYRTGHLHRAKACYEEALRLVRENDDRLQEGLWLGNLANCTADLGQTARAIEMRKHALRIRRELTDRKGEAVNLGNLASLYTDIGRNALAIDHYKQAITIDREEQEHGDLALNLANLGEVYACVGETDEAANCNKEALAVARQTSYRMIEAQVHANVGELELLSDNFEEAKSAFEKSIEIADDIGILELQILARCGASRASILNNDPEEARRLVKSARQLSYGPLHDIRSSVLLGVVSYIQSDLNPAKKAFIATIAEADALLAETPELYAALDAKAIALCGLALCGDNERTSTAREAFRAARAITSATGTVHLLLQLFDVLSRRDQSHLLVDLRTAAAGES